MIGKNYMRAVAQKKTPADFDAGFFQVFELADQRGGIHHRSGSDLSFFVRPKNTAGDQLKNVFMSIEDNGVAGVVSAGIACGVIERGSQIVNDFAFALVAPLRSDYDDRLCSGLLRHSRSH